MKKMVAVLLCIALLATSGILFAACSKTDNTKDNTTTNQTGDIVGGWQKADSPVITDDVTKLVKKATEKLTGADYAPVAYIASQVVAGTNHRILCKVTPVTQNATPTYALVTIYEDLEGNAEMTEVLNSEAHAAYANNDGGWAEAQSPVVTDDAKKALTTATEAMDGATYEPLALLGTQVVGGFNYRILCAVTPVVQNPETTYEIVTVYADLDDNAEITQNENFEK